MLAHSLMKGQLLDMLTGWHALRYPFITLVWEGSCLMSGSMDAWGYWSLLSVYGPSYPEIDPCQVWVLICSPMYSSIQLGLSVSARYY
uniref:Uncharacterized protein n=2 Tax=Picea TaxID=3328 RepID=A0A101M5G2_PICGL|nr:hypothetical protein ABT39_MTgene1187 [Picea glauca]QHR91607.1 hypothetical protein Q903MT_gene5642 [Picea sitchensis]